MYLLHSNLIFCNKICYIIFMLCFHKYLLSTFYPHTIMRNMWILLNTIILNILYIYTDLILTSALTVYMYVSVHEISILFSKVQISLISDNTEVSTRLNVYIFIRTTICICSFCMRAAKTAFRQDLHCYTVCKGKKSLDKRIQ